MDALERYVHDLSSPEEELLHELDRQTHLRVVQPRMLSWHIQGKLLELLVRMLRPRNILEIGTFTGYSALCMAAGLEEDGVLDTVEVDDELEEFAASFFRRSPHGQKIRQHIGSALDIVPTLGYTFDLVFIDGDKREYPDYYRMLMGDGGSKVLVHSGSILIADNILWSGKIVEPVAHNDRHTQALLEFNRMIRSIGRVPHSDNLMVTRETAMPELAAKLGLDPEREHTLVFVRRRVLADETPVLYSTDILPLALFGGKRLDTIDFSRPIFEIVEQHCHVEVTETLTTLQAVQGVPGIRRQLGLRPEQALLQLDEICYSRTCKPVLCCQTCYTDFFDFAMVRKLI